MSLNPVLLCCFQVFRVRSFWVVPLFLLGLFPAQGLGQAHDSLKVSLPKPSSVRIKPSSLTKDSTWLPKPKETLRWALLPGGGQYYNRQVWKMPFVYAGLGTALGFSIYFKQKHDLYDAAYKYIRAVELYCKSSVCSTEFEAYAQYKDSYLKLSPNANIAASPIGTAREKLYRNQWMSYLAVGGVWALAAAEAYIYANLADFDVSEDIKISVLPVPGKMHLRFQWRIH